ncbi:DedA family protein [Jannaschia seohaensis]|uniref:Membrane protein DedA with SNARE-associated domain n=1 Tax=Jannaschia seohaensis TaxID=475081 RepID=A0A2Y9AJY7_9RHOB|nr:DedA family protein [Jannaschia seohaensis]PWJ20544.1 membrane protein DedA with SNARE-associated domain [Jannaschia seohaensis]SSA44640.1 membrane protein DedA, SNARE-associated domain [Jannaschia seohaensis]
MTELLLDALPTYGLPALFAAIVLACLGLPLPASMLLLLSGAFVASGDLPLVATVLTAFASAVIGDNVGFLLGRYASTFLAGHTEATEKVGRYLQERGTWAIFLSRWLVAPLGPAVNLAAGAGATSWRRFLLPELAGEVVWVGLYISLGAAFGHALAMISDALSTLIGLATSLTLMAVALKLLWRRGTKDRPSIGLSKGP